MVTVKCVLYLLAGVFLLCVFLCIYLKVGLYGTPGRIICSVKMKHVMMALPDEWHVCVTVNGGGLSQLICHTH